MNKRKKREMKIKQTEEKKTNKQTLNYREQTDGYQRGWVKLVKVIQNTLIIGYWVLLGSSVSWASDFSLGHDLRVCEFEPHIGLTAVSLSMQSLLWILCPPLWPSATCALSFKKSIKH